MIPIAAKNVRHMMSRRRSIIIVEMDLLDGFSSCRYKVLIRSPLLPGVSVPTNVPIMDTLHEFLREYFSSSVSIIFFQRRPFSSIIIGIMRKAVIK